MHKSMILQVLTVSLVLAGVPMAARAQTCPDAAKLTTGFTGPIATVRYLADDALAGRVGGSPGERCAGEFIGATFAKLGLAPAGDSGTFFQSFDLASAVNPHAPKGSGRNVVALLEGSDPALRGEYIIVGAHYDHLGMGAFGSASGDTTPAIHNGADDNASGVAAMLEVAARLATADRPTRSVLFIAFSGEESGLIGSTYYTNHPHAPLTQARGMLNLDMVGRLGAGPLIVYGVGTASEWPALVTRLGEQHNVQITQVGDGYGASDHTSFYLRDIPVLHFFSNVHGDYHKPSDDWEKIDVAGLIKVSDLVTDVARGIANKETTLSLIKGAGRPQGASPARGSGASLGTVPDFTPVAKGVKLSGVRAAGPADVAGLKGGDVIVRFDDDEIADLQDMTNELSKRKPGETVRVTVLRDGAEVVLTAILGKR